MQVAALNVLTVRMGRMVVRIILMIVVSEVIMPQKRKRIKNEDEDPDGDYATSKEEKRKRR